MNKRIPLMLGTFTFISSLECNATQHLEHFLYSPSALSWKETCKMFLTQAGFFSCLNALNQYMHHCMIHRGSVKNCGDFLSRNF